MDELLIKYLLGEADPDEIARVRDWIADSPENARRFEQFRGVWEMSRGVVPAAPDRGEAWERMRQRVDGGLGEGRTWRAEEKSEGSRARPWQVAAVLAGLLFVGGAVWVAQDTERPAPVTAAAKKTADASTKKIKNRQTADPVAASDTIQTLFAGDTGRTDTLADGSIVTLGKHSQIRFPGDMKRKGRNLFLEGEAFFSVAPDPSHPFIVRTDNITVRVLGTSFTIRCGPKLTEVIVKTGFVQVLHDSDSVVLKEGRRYVVQQKKPRIVAEDSGHRAITRAIIDDLVWFRIVPNKDSLRWFGLDNAQFVVDGRKMSDSLHIEFRSKYIGPDGNGYFYGSPGELKVHGRGYFYEKKDLYRHPGNP
jgi:ferric-dicitrate binding protein FerR (iron transport regulator)